VTREARKTRVLVTGAAGGIGTAFFRYARARYDLRLADLPGTSLPEATKSAESSHEVRHFDLSDAGTTLEACRGVDAVVHLGADPSPEADFEDSLLQNNILGTFNVLRAAHEAGCARVVLASSVHAVEGYPPNVQVLPSMPGRPKNPYGVSKCFAEALASYYATEKGLSCVAVRIGAFVQYPEDHESTDAHFLSLFVSPRDLCQLLCKCVEASAETKFAIAHGISDNRFKRLDISDTRTTLGYEPEDDAFRIFGVLLD
jgi:nucleoside-diphosphate-sugar epimerase